MNTLSGLPYAKAEFDKYQAPLDPEQDNTISKWVGEQSITDLIVLSHGWNNDMTEAKQLYEDIITSIKTRLEAGSGGGLQKRTLGVLGIFWPSKKFGDKDLIPGGAASAAGELEDNLLLEHLDNLKGFFDTDDADDSLRELGRLVQDLEFDPAARDKFFRTARSLIGPVVELDLEDREEIPGSFLNAETQDDVAGLFEDLKKPDPPGVFTSSTSSGAAGLSLSGFKAGARRMLNYITYYQMKKRARKTGVLAVQPLLRTIRQEHDGTRFHLVGHSFGGLVVTSAAWGGDGNEPDISIDTMTLLQAAFSHNGFAVDFYDGRDGRYRKVIENKRVLGPILITHTHNDKAVGLAYALASRFANQDAAAIGIGGPHDRFGGIGANGAQHTPEAVNRKLEDPPAAYGFEMGKVFNLLADKQIKEHSDVRGVAIAHAIVEAIASIPINQKKIKLGVRV